MIRAEWIAKVYPIARNVKCPLCMMAAGKNCVLLNPRRTKSGRMRTEALGPHFERLSLSRGA